MTQPEKRDEKPPQSAVRAAGLTTAEATRRALESGPNALSEARREPGWRRVLRQFESPLVLLLLGALAIDLVVWLRRAGGEAPFEAAAIAAILVLNAALGYWQERKAERALDALRELTAPQVWALRDGGLVRLPAMQLVPGDVIRLESGERVPADAHAIEVHDLSVDEAVLTGESMPVSKNQGDELLAGTLIVRGRGWGEVTRIGAASAVGRIATMLTTVRQEPTLLERRLARFGRQVALVVVGLALLLVGAGLLADGAERFLEIFLLAVALAVAAVPEGLPAALTFALALGVQRMAGRRAVVRRLDAVESLGAVTVIAVDKTGTITENRLEVREVDSPDPALAMRAMILANDAEPDTAAGDPLDLALFEYARRQGQSPQAVQEEAPRTGSRGFDSASRSMRVTVLEHGRPVSYLKGAPEGLVARSALSEEERKQWLERAAKRGAEGLRPVALARAQGEEEEGGVTWLGLVALWDPPRPEVAPAVAQARSAGIRIIMVTGDHPATARAVARAVGMDDEPFLTGDEVDRLDDTALGKVVRETVVFARTSPEHKLRIVESLQAQGEVVAVTGDGVNDAPALKKADVGIAMGRRGSAVSREVADLVLLDDHFATIIAAIDEGRSIFENIRKFLRFLFSTNLSEVLVVAGGFVAALTLGLRESDGALLLPLTAAQLLWINLITDGAPALALAFDRNPDVLRRTPRPTDEPLLDGPSLRFIVSTGLTKSLIAGALLVLLPRAAVSPEGVRTAVFVFLASGQVLFAYPARGAPALPRNRPLLIAVLVGLILQPALVLTPGLHPLLDLAPLPPIGWVVVAAGMTTSWAVAAATTRVLWGKRTR